jgi:hypothetical protein
MHRKPIVIAVLLVVLAGIAYRLLHPATPIAREQAYVYERRATVWNRLATVREPVSSLPYGQSVGAIETKLWGGADYVRVLLPGNLTGWVDAKQLMSADVWQRAQTNLDKSKAMPLQAVGKTKVLTNLRVEPGRAAPRSFQLARDLPVEIFSRTAVERPPDESPPTKKAEDQADEQTPDQRREDWFFIRCNDADVGYLAGWVLGRFIELDLPAPLRDYGAGLHFIAWFELNRVPVSLKEISETAPAESVAQAMQAPTMGQYLAAAVTGGEGQACDFSRLRFYTWNAARRRYETAYIESDFCARLPIRVTPIPPGANPEKSEASFNFTALGKAGEEIREYRMKQNVIRRLRARK